MFEDSLFSSQSQPTTSRRRWTTAASIGIQAVIAGAIVIVPLFSPASLPRLSTAPTAIQFLPHLTPPPPKPMVVKLTTTTSSTAISAPSQPTVELVRGTLTTKAGPTVADDGPAPLMATGSGMSDPSGFASILGTGSGTGPRVSAAGSGGGGAHAGAPVRISSGVSAGMLLAEIKPVYPRIAVAARQQGTVLLSAIIDKNGRITALQAVSGPEMLRGAALDAVRVARYRPFLLNGEPTEVQTTISVNFRMDGQA